MASIKITKFTVCQYQWRAFAKYNPLYMYMYIYMQVSLNILTAEPEPPQGKCKFSSLRKNEKKNMLHVHWNPYPWNEDISLKQDTKQGPSYIEQCTELPLKLGHLL